MTYENKKARIVLFGKKNLLINFTLELNNIYKKYPENIHMIISKLFKGESVEAIHQYIYDDYIENLNQINKIKKFIN